jgi:CheY-like chemotaxis protein
MVHEPSPIVGDPEIAAHRRSTVKHLGDAYVATTLEALVKDPELLESTYPPRVTLYRLFSTIWNSVRVNETAEPVTNLVAAERHLNQITARPRQAFLLISVEGFSEEHAAYILDVDAPALRKLVEESGRELAAQIATDVLIIEDEALIALDLEALVENLGHRVLGVARTRSEATALARSHRPGLVRPTSSSPMAVPGSMQSMTCSTRSRCR